MNADAGPDDLADAVQALLDGSLDATGCTRLEARLASDPAAAAAVGELLATDALLAASQVPAQRASVLAALPRPELPHLASRVLRVVRKRRQRRRTAQRTWALLAVAAVAVLLVVGLSWRRDRSAPTAPAAAVVTSAGADAVIIGTAGRRAAAVGAAVADGERLFGRLGLRLAGGSTCDLAAATVATIDHAAGRPGLRLETGSVAVVIVAAEHGLWVATAHGRLTDLGTRFRVAARADETWLTVETGRVEAVSPGGRLVGASGDEIVLRPGQAPLRIPAADADIVLGAADAVVRGRWQRRAQPGAAGGVALDLALTAPVRKTDGALAEPADLIEFRFAARAGVDYRLWLRVDAAPGLRNSVWVQTDGAVDAAGAAVHRSGTTAAFALNAREFPVAQGWSWIADFHSNDGTLAQPPQRVTPPLRFAQSGMQVLRLQAREPGVRFDQVVLSPVRWRQQPPGAESGDATILGR